MTLLVPALALAQSAGPTQPADPTPEEPATPARDASKAAPPAKTTGGEDGWPDMSSFLDEKYGFLPLAMPITEPAVGYGAMGGVAFLSKSFGDAAAGLGRPNVTFAGGFGTANKSWGAMAMDSRYWLEDHVQTLAGFIHARVNLDFYGIGEDSALKDAPVRYTLEPTAGALVGKYRLGESSTWVGLGYAFASTKITVDSPEATPGLPDHEDRSNLGALLPSVYYDNRDNIFTPVRGIYIEGSAMIAAKWLGGDDNFEKIGLTILQYVPLPADLYLGLRAEGDAAFGDAPFYTQPYIGMRGVPVMRYQGEEVVVLEAELRWQFWRRFSLVGFFGGGNAWNDFEQLDNSQGVVAGGGGFRYELARKFGLHMGVDVAFSKDTTAFYLQVGSAWMRP
ncbi:MAG TPA: BamA/TamA family outer membrane protein [Polyangiaceae bacterium]